MLVKSITTTNADVMLVPGDIHFDVHDPLALDLMLQVARAYKVNMVTLVGDTFESAGISRHSRPYRKFTSGGGTIKAERAAAQPYLEALDAIVSLNRGGRTGGLHVLTGNHEHWWAGVQDEYPGLVDTPWHEVYGDIFNGWHVYAEHTALKFGPLLVCHGHRLRGALAVASASTVLRNYPGQNTLYGHTHRIDSCITPTFKYGLPVAHGAWTIGHLRDPALELSDPVVGSVAERHSQGFALVFFHTIDGKIQFKVDLVKVERDKRNRPWCIVGGVLFK